MHMNYANFKTLFNNNGFYPLDTDVQHTCGYFHTEGSDSAQIIYLINNTDNNALTVQQLTTIDNQGFRLFFFKGFHNIQSLFIIISDNIDRDKSLCDINSNVWIYDSLAERMLKYENQPEDFCNINSFLEESSLKHFGGNAGRINPAIPIVTIILVVINVLSFIISEFFGDTGDVIYMHKTGALCYHCVVNNHEYYRLFTSSFLHAGFDHLFNNMLTFTLLGNELENHIGRLRFLIIYLISAIIANITSLICNYANIFGNLSDRYVISVGASGAIMGIAGALIVYLLKSRKNIDRSRGSRFLVIMLLMCYTGFASTEIDNFAHIGGLLGGIILSLFMVKC